MKRKLLRILGSLVLVGAIYTGYHFSRLLPLATGMGAKTLCSCVWVGDRAVDNVVKNELNIYPLSLVSYGVDRQDSSATASFLGMFKRTAQFRPGLGCLLNVPVQYVSGSGEYRVTPPADSILSNPWPVGNVVKKRFPEEIDSVRMKEIVKKAFEDKTGLRQMRTILVVYDGQIIIEEYREGFGPESKQMGWSMSKSILNGLIGMAVKNELISLDESSLFPDWTDVRAKITVDHLITQSSGLKWQEDYSNRSAVTEMLFESPDMAAYAMDRALLTPPPGKYFWYSSGNSNLLSDLLKQRIGEKEYLPFIYEDFLHKIGMYNTVIETDASGTYVGSSYTYATARDWARFGWLYCQGGAWKGEQILPKSWIDYTTVPSPASAEGNYGAHFWLNHGSNDNPNHVDGIIPGVPKDAFWADGFEGQRVFIIPSKKLVIVRLAMTRGNNLNERAFLSEMMACVKR